MSRLTRIAARAAIAAAIALAAVGARADGLLIGVAAPLTGPSARLGAQVQAGAQAAATSVSPAATLDIVDDQCSAEGGAKAANDLVAAKVGLVVGFLCTESIEAAMPILKQAGIPVITVGVRTNSLTDRKVKTGWPVFRLAPRSDAEGAAVASILIELWRQELFAIIDDGTIYGRELAETLRSESEKAGLTAVYIDQFRPQLDNQIGLAGRLRKAGATHVFVGGDLDDIAILGRDAATLGYDLTIGAGETLRAAAGEVPLPIGTLMVGLPEWAEVAPPAAVKAIRGQGAEPEGYALPTYAAVEIANAANADAMATNGKLLDSIGKGSFDTAIGPIKFDDKGDLSESPYKLYQFDGKKFVEVELPVTFQAGPRNLITDVAGLRVGNAADERIKSGTTVVVCDEPAVAGVQVLGGAPGTRETDLLEPHNSVEAINAIVLSGGSAFGLDAASGAQAALREMGVGFEVGGHRIPIVPTAIVFDLRNGGDKDWGRYPPYRELGYEAVQAASTDFALGTIGAGTGALVSGLKGGLGSASTVLPNGVTVGALAVVNATGSVTVGRSSHFWAAPWELGDEFGGLGFPQPFPSDAQQVRLKFRDKPRAGENTTIAVIATDAVMTKAGAKRLAISAHDGFARAIWPAHTPVDGDLVFALATGRSGITLELDNAIDHYAAASATMARAIARAVYSASPAAGDLFPIWRDRSPR